MRRRFDIAWDRLSMLCTLAGLEPLAWLEMDARAFEQVVRRRATS